MIDAVIHHATIVPSQAVRDCRVVCRGFDRRRRAKPSKTDQAHLWGMHLWLRHQLSSLPDEIRQGLRRVWTMSFGARNVHGAMRKAERESIQARKANTAMSCGMLDRVQRVWSTGALVLFLIAAQTAIISSHRFAAGASEAVRVGAVGDSFVLELNGNPSTGYRWKINETKSENLGILQVDDLGYSAAKKQEGKVLVGAPQSYRFRITLKASGAAKIAFEYLRSWEGRPIRAFEQRVQVR